MLVPLRPAPAMNRTFRVRLHGGQRRPRVCCAHEAAPPPPTGRQRRDPGVQRGGLPARVPRQPARPDPSRARGRDRRRRLDRRVGFDRGRVRRPRPPAARRTHGEPGSRRRPQRGGQTRLGPVSGVPGQRRRAAAEGVSRDGQAARGRRLGLRQRQLRALGERRAARAAVDAAVALAPPGRDPRRRPSGDPGRRDGVGQDVPTLVLGLRRPVLAGGHPLRGSADDHQGLPAWAVRRHPRHRLPLADPHRRLLAHPADGLRCRISSTGSRPSG